MQYVFACGLPRSGSTLALNILAQNPRMQVTATSPLPEIIAPIRNGWRNIESVRAMEQEQSDELLHNVMSGVLFGAYPELPSHDATIIKSRSWLTMIETLTVLMDEPPKLLVFVRPIHEILASLELLHRKTRALGVTSQELAAPLEFATIESRCQYWARYDQLLGSAFNILKNAIDCGYSPLMHYVGFGELTESPRATFESIYNWLELEPFEHDFSNVQQVISENDVAAYSIRDLHTIREQVAPVPPRARKVLGEKLAAQYSGLLSGLGICNR